MACALSSFENLRVEQALWTRLSYRNMNYNGSFGSAFRIPSVDWKPAAQANHTATMDKAFRLRTESIHHANVANPQTSMTARTTVQTIIQNRPLLNMLHLLVAEADSNGISGL